MKYDALIKALPKTAVEVLYRHMGECQRRLAKSYDEDLEQFFFIVRTELKDRFAVVKRRPNIDYFALGLNAGDRIEVIGFPDENVDVRTNRTLNWNGQEIYLTPLRERLKETHGRSFPSGSFQVGDKKLVDLYCDVFDFAAGDVDLEESQDELAVV